MMDEILKPLLDNEILTDDVKKIITEGLDAAMKVKEDAIKADLSKAFESKKEQVKNNIEGAVKNLDTEYKTKIAELNETIDELNEENNNLISDLEEIEARPFVNISESDMEQAEKKLTAELEEKYEGAFDIAKEKFNETFTMVQEENSLILEEANELVDMQQETIEQLNETIENMQNEIDKLINDNNVEIAVEKSLKEAQEAHIKEIETMKENLVTSAEIMLEQELTELKTDYKSIIKENKGKELLESLKDVVKEYWDIDAEVADELLEMKKSTEIKLDQYKDLLKKEHSRLEESEQEKEDLRKKLLIENKANYLTTDKKEQLSELTESMDSKELEQSIDTLMESVLNSFEDSFNTAPKEQAPVKKIETPIETIVESTLVTGNEELSKKSENLKSLLELAGIKG